MHARSLQRTARLGVLLCGLAGCGTTDVEMDLGPLDPEGVWRLTTGETETTLLLAGDGSLGRVLAVFGTESCVSSTGTWSVDGNRLVTQITEVGGVSSSIRESYTFELVSSELALTDGGGVQAFAPVSRMPSCVDYGWGSWIGELRADVDGTTETFSDLEVEIDVDGGRLTITSQFRPCDTCAIEGSRLILRADARPDELRTGGYTVQNVPGAVRTFYGLFHPTPGDPDFLGFDTTRLSPPGAFVVSNVTPERIAGTFEFQGNPRVEGETGPGGSTSTLLTNGRLDLEYR